MDVENQNVKSSSSSFSTPDVTPEDHDDGLTHYPHHLGTVIANRIFVGGVDYKVEESDLLHFFSQYGAVKEAKIVYDRFGRSKGYGFVTFENQDAALRILRNNNAIWLKEKRLCVGQAIRKQRASRKTKSAPVAGLESAVPLLTPSGPLHQSMSTGHPFTYHNRGICFHCPSMNHSSHLWPRSAPPVMLPQCYHPLYQQTLCRCYQCVPSQYQWNVLQSPMPSSPVVYSQPTQYLYRPADEGSVQPPQPVMEDITPEQLTEHTVPQVNPSHPHTTEGTSTDVLQCDPEEQPKCSQYTNGKDCHCLPEATEPPSASVPHTYEDPIED